MDQAAATVPPQVLSTTDQHPVQALTADAANPPLRDRVRPWRPHEVGVTALAGSLGSAAQRVDDYPGLPRFLDDVLSTLPATRRRGSSSPGCRVTALNRQADWRRRDQAWSDLNTSTQAEPEESAIPAARPRHHAPAGEHVRLACQPGSLTCRYAAKKRSAPQ